MTTTAEWRGTKTENDRLLQALSRWCKCQWEEDALVSLCAGHEMLATNQRALDGLLFMYRIAGQLRDEERCLTRA